MSDDYISHIILLPQYADWRWYETLRPYLEEYRVTVTKSADDAGSFHGAQHTVTILESPEAWPAGIVPFFKSHYPNARLDYIPFTSLAQLGNILGQRIAQGAPGRFAGAQLQGPFGPAPALPAYDSHIVLLPNGADWVWYQSIQRYLLHYRVTVTQSADDAGSFHGRNHTVTAIVYPGAWGGDDIAAYLNTRYPNARVDLVQIATTDELISRLDKRIVRGEEGRFGQGEPYPGAPAPWDLASFTLNWPLDTHRVAMPGYRSFSRLFAASPWAYRPGRPAHEGLDFPAPAGEPIYACADGVVQDMSKVDNNAYGLFVRLRHTWGNDTYETVYGHMSEVLVDQIGQAVHAGQLIGKVGATGRATGPHLHLNLERLNTQSGLYRRGYLDPSLYVKWPEGWVLAQRDDLPGIYGVHEDYLGPDPHPRARERMRQAGVNGYVLWTEAIGADANEMGGVDFRQRNTGAHTVIVRLNHGYEPDGTLPTPDKYDAFARRCGNFARNSQGAHIYLIGNEMNNPREWPHNVPITPDDYARCFNQVYRRIKDADPDAVVCPGAIDPYNAALFFAPYNSAYGDIRQYWQEMLNRIDACDGLAIHAYTHGPDPKLVEDEDTKFSNPPLERMRYHFWVFEDVLNATPDRFRRLPAYLTETNHLFVDQEPNWGWLNTDQGWVWSMYQQVDEWNKRGGQQIHCELLYRYPQLDAWSIVDKSQVIQDFREALTLKLRPYYWRL